jgi:ABC-type Mn2+/Zn2+ transport system ATPase subunit
VEKLGLKDILNLPLIPLSNEQTKKARIARAVMKPPEFVGRAVK